MKVTYTKHQYSSGEIMVVYKHTENESIGIYGVGSVNFWAKGVGKDNAVKATAKEFNEFRKMAIQKLTKA